LFGSAGTCAKAPVLNISAAHRAPAVNIKRRIEFLPRVLPDFASIHALAGLAQGWLKLSELACPRNTGRSTKVSLPQRGIFFSGRC
jgi:hypothetical protein